MTAGWLRWKHVMCFFGSGIQVSMQAVCRAYFQRVRSWLLPNCKLWFASSSATYALPHTAQDPEQQPILAASWPLLSSDNLVMDCSVTWHRPGPASFTWSHCSGKLHCTFSKGINFATNFFLLCLNSDVPQCLMLLCYWKQPKVTHFHEPFPWVQFSLKLVLCLVISSVIQLSGKYFHGQHHRVLYLSSWLVFVLSARHLSVGKFLSLFQLLSLVSYVFLSWST